MAFQDKYSVSKRGQTAGPFTAVEIIDLLRMKELSTIHKVKLGQDWLTVSDFIDRYEKGLLPEQNLDKVFEDSEQEGVKDEEVQKEVDSEPEQVTEPEPEPEPVPVEIEVPEPGPATEIHVNRSGTQFGPYLLKELKDYLKAGNLRFSDLVWFDGVPEWVPLSKIPGVADGLSSLGSAAPPPPKPPPAPAVPAGPPPLSAVPSSPSIAKQTIASESVQTAADEEEDEDAEKDSSIENDLPQDNLSSHGARLTAGLVDGLILSIVVGTLFGIAGAVSQFDNTLIIAAIVAYFLLGWLYFGLGESSKSGGFIGKKMAKIKVVRLSDNQTPGFGAASLRAILKILFSLTIILPFIVFLTPRRQGLHDLACGTVVKALDET